MPFMRESAVLENGSEGRRIMLDYLDRIIEELELAEENLSPAEYRNLIRELQIAIEEA